MPIDLTPCDELLQYLDDSIDQELTVDDQQLVDAHLASCKRCSMIFENKKASLKALRDSVSNVEVPERLLENIIKQLTRDD